MEKKHTVRLEKKEETISVGRGVMLNLVRGLSFSNSGAVDVE